MSSPFTRKSQDSNGFSVRRSGEQRRIKGSEVQNESARHFREESNLSIRKDKKNQHIAKKRNLIYTKNSNQQTEPENEGLSEGEIPQVSKIPEYYQELTSSDLNTQIQGVVKFRCLLAIDHNSPISEVIASGAVMIFIQFLHFANHKLQYEAAWCLTNIASGTTEHTQYLVGKGVVMPLVQLLSHPSEQLREQVTWCLGNIAGDGPQARDWILSHSAMPLILAQIEEGASIKLVRVATWTVSNLCRGRPLPKFEHVMLAIPKLASIIHTMDTDVLTDICWAFTHLTEGGEERIQEVLNSGVVRRMTQLTMHHNLAIQTPALRTIGNIVTGNDEQTQVVLDVSALPCLAALLAMPRSSIVKEACWVISNITAGNKDQIEEILVAGIIPDLINLLNNAEFDVRKEAAWAVSNAVACGSDAQIRYIVGEGAIKPFCDLLDFPDTRLLGVCLEALENILRVGEKDAEHYGYNKYAIEVDQAEGFDKIDKLTLFDSECIVTKATRIISTFLQPHADIDLQPVFSHLNVPMDSTQPLGPPPKNFFDNPQVSNPNNNTGSQDPPRSPHQQTLYSPEAFSPQAPLTFNFVPSQPPEGGYNFSDL